MNQVSPVVILEFNELTPSLLDRFIAEGQLPSFSRFFREAEVFVTDAEEDAGHNLDPWIQWVTVHTGMSAAQHGVRHLSELAVDGTQFIWDLASNAGMKAWVCGSMNAEHSPMLNGLVLPDPWSTHIQPYPGDTFESYYRFIRSSVQEHSNDDAPLSRSDAFKFVSFMARHGLSWNTIRSTLHQLMRERGGKYRWRRASVMDQMQWDVFRHFYLKYKPQLSTFFLNSTAHYQHCFWRNMAPHEFELKPSIAEQAELSTAVLYGYQQMDSILDNFMKLAKDEATLIFCTALSQQPYLDQEASGGKVHYRLKNGEVLQECLGSDKPYTYEPVMSEQFYLVFRNSDDTHGAKRLLADLRVEGEPLFSLTIEENRLFCGCAFHRQIPEEALIQTSGQSVGIPFDALFYRADSVKSAYHHPDGCFWLRRPYGKHKVYGDKISLRSVAPTVLELLQLPCPDQMTCDSVLRTGETAVA